jgi:hypothetical protein
VYEVMEERVRPGPADERRQRVEVVVVDHHDRVLDVLDLLHDGAREILVDDVVAELEGLDLVAADVRRVREVPEVMLDEPQHRVREDVVEAVVGVGVALDQAHLERAPAVVGTHLEGLAAGLLRAPGVALGQRRGDPHRVAVRGQAGQRGHQAARPALEAAVVVEGDRPPVGDQDQRPLAGALLLVVAHALPSVTGVAMRRRPACGRRSFSTS